MHSAILGYMFVSWGVITAVLVALVIYGNALATREDDEIYLNRAEDVMMGAEQRVLIGKMHHLARIITALGTVSVVLFLACAGLWVWVGLYGS